MQSNSNPPSSNSSDPPRRREEPPDNGTIPPRPGNRDFPYVISPRSTSLLTNRPALQWNLAANARNYTVTVRASRREELSWTQQVSADQVCRELTCELEYPGDRPPLEAEVNYTLVIAADNDSTSEEESTAGLGFLLIEPVRATEVNEAAQRIEAQSLPASEKSLDLASLYYSNELIAEAIQVLISLPQSEKTTEVYLWSGGLYRIIGLTLEAEVEYSKAIELAEASQNKLDLAKAQVGLGEISYALGRRNDAVRLLKAAKAIFEELGDTQRVSKLTERLAELNL